MRLSTILYRNLKRTARSQQPLGTVLGGISPNLQVVPMVTESLFPHTSFGSGRERSPPLIISIPGKRPVAVHVEERVDVQETSLLELGAGYSFGPETSAQLRLHFG